MVIVLIPSTCARARALYNFAGDYIFVNSNVSAKTSEVCDRLAIDFIKHIVIVMVILGAAFSVGGFQPALKTFLSDERILFIPIVMPFTDPNTPNGFYLNLVHQMAGGALGIIGIFVVEMVTCVVRNTSITIAAVIVNSISEFIDLLKINNRFPRKNKWHFRNIIQKLLDFYGLVKACLFYVFL